MKQPKILFLDIETSFQIAGVWGRYNQDISSQQVFQDFYVLCWAAAWAGDDHIWCDALHYHKSHYRKNPSCDKKVLQSLWKLLDEADYIVAHNGDRFDVPKLNARFIQVGLRPPSTYQQIDTLKMAKESFRFSSNRLDDLGQQLGVGRKLDTGGFSLWKQIVIDGDLKAFDKMVDYNIQDIELLEAVYHKLKPWSKRHPNIRLITDEMACNSCGSTKIMKNGYYNTNTQKYRKYRCSDCGHNMRSRTAEKLSQDQKKNILRSI